MTDTAYTPAEQEIALTDALKRATKQGWTVASVSGGRAVLQRKKRIGWLVNGILAVLTGGLWLIVIIVRLVNRKIETQILTVDAYGKVSRA